MIILGGANMNYQEALDYIHGTYKFGSKLGLDNIRYLLELMDNPQKDLNIIHVAGTNGKGSTSSFLSSILVEEGYKVGLFTSPYLEEFTERIRINNKNIPKKDLGNITEKVKIKVDQMIKEGKSHPTEFEIVTAIAFEYFKEKKVDYVVLEVGLGGRLDSTNVIEKPLVSVITPIDMDHRDYLGDTLKEIAYEKAGIIKEKGFVVSHSQNPEALEVLKEVCCERESKLFIAPINDIDIKTYNGLETLFDIDINNKKYENMVIKLIGKHQANNATVALTTIEVLKQYYGLKISIESIKEGLKKAKWPGRLEVLSRKPYLLIDGAHNPHGAKALREAIKEIFEFDRLIGVIGILGDKDVDGILSEIVPLCDKVIVTKPNNPRALSIDKLASKIVTYKNDNQIIKSESISNAVDISIKISESNDLIVYFGSLYMIGEVRTKLMEKIDV